MAVAAVRARAEVAEAVWARAAAEAAAWVTAAEAAQRVLATAAETSEAAVRPAVKAALLDI